MKPSGLGAHPYCFAARDILNIIGAKWSVLVISLLGQRPRRFSELKREIGDITQKSLTAVLRDLEANGLVARVVTPTVPPRVDYSLTPLGYSLLAPIEAIRDWAIQNHPAVVEARESYAA